MIARLLSILKDLVLSFSYEEGEGLSQKTFEATYNLIEILLGETKANIFSSLIHRSEGRYYFRTTEAAYNCWQELIKV